VRRLVDLQTQMNLTLGDCIGLVERQLPKPVYSKQEVCDLIGVSAEELDATSLSERSRHGRLQLRCAAVYFYIASIKCSTSYRIVSVDHSVTPEWPRLMKRI